MTRGYLTGGSRLILFVLYLAFLLGVSRALFGSWLPSTAANGVWFWAGLFALILGALIVTPFFQKPADAISYAVSAAAALLALGNPLRDQAETWLNILWVGALVYVALVLGLAFLSMVAGRATSEVLSTLGTRVFRATNDLSNPRAIFAVVFVVALVAFHRETGREFGVLFVVGAILMLRPLEIVWVVMVELSNGELTGAVGELFARQEPGILIARLRQDARIARGDIVGAKVNKDEVAVGVVLDRQLLAGEEWLRIARFATPDLTDFQLRSLLPEGTEVGTVQRLGADSIGLVASDSIGAVMKREASTLVGIVAQGSNLNIAAFDVVSPALGIREGRLVRIRIGSEDTLYQVIDGVSTEEILAAQNRHGFARARARKIGTWDGERNRFRRADWLPSMNEPVFLLDLDDAPLPPGAIGRLPGSAFGVHLEVDPLVTHNTAILGILGVGKTTMAFEIIDRVLAADVKVVVLDLTDEYGPALGATDVPSGHDLVTKVWGKADWRPNQEEGGGVDQFRGELRSFLRGFYDGADSLLVINPTDFDVWKQSGYYQQRAPETTQMASLSAAEITN